MKTSERMERMRALVTELGEHLDALTVESLMEGAEALGGPALRETVDVDYNPSVSGEPATIAYGYASDLVIAQFMTLVTPLAVPTELGAARGLFEQLAAEAEYVGRRESGGYLWAIRLVDNGRYWLWTDSQGTIETVDYGTHRS